MHELVAQYAAHVAFPEVSGAEHLEMLQLRDKILSVESSLTITDKRALAIADRRLVKLANEFYTELSRFINFEDRRKRQHIPPSRWWWYLDVLAQLPITSTAKRNEAIAI